MQCKAKTTKGDRCKNNAHGHYCSVHTHTKKSPSYHISIPRHVGPLDDRSQHHIDQLLYFIMGNDLDFIPDERYVTKNSYSAVRQYLPRVLNDHQKRRLNFVKHWSNSK